MPASIPSAEAVGIPTFSLREDWWAASYIYRRPIQLTALVEEIPAGQYVQVSVDGDFIGQGKVRSDGQDVEIAYQVDDQWVWIGRSLWTYDDHIEFAFDTGSPIPQGETATYYMYYGNPLGEGFDRPSSPSGQLIPVPYDNPRIAYTRPEEHWRDGVTNVRGARATFAFTGPAVAIWGYRGPLGPTALVQVDDGPWQKVSFYFYAEYELPVFATYSLTPTELHHVRLKYDGPARPLEGSMRLTRFEYRAALDVVVGAEEILATGWRGGGVGGGSG